MMTGHPLALFCVTVAIALSSSAGQINGQQKDDYHIDVLVYLDYAFYDNWLKETNMSDSPQAQNATKEYIAYLFQGVNRRYRAITSLPFNISVHVSQVEIARTPQDANWTESVKTDTGSSRPQVNATSVLENLNQFVTDSYSTLPPFDHLMLFTRYDVVGNTKEGKYTAGLAYVGTICTNSSVSIIEDGGGAVSEATAAHELAHSLGAFHDGTNNNCNSSDLFAMTNFGANPNVKDSDPLRKLNLWTFSECSLSYFNDTVQKLKTDGLESKCLKTKQPQVGVPPVPDNLPTPPDQQCRHIYNDSSYLCRLPYAPPNSSLEDLCLKMACYNPYLAGECTVHTADAGTCCGQGKWCQQGRCVENELNSKCSNINDSCPFGDQPADVKFAGASESISCDKLKKNYCYMKEARAKCCEKCEKSRSDDVDCEYGDIDLNCELTPFCGNATYAKRCCEKCKPYNPNECKDSTGDVTVKSLIDSCSAHLNVTERRRFCYDASFRNACCQSCEKARTNNSGCLFGDLAEGCSEQNCAKDAHLCCQTCTRTTSTPIPTTATTTYTTTVTAASTTTPTTTKTTTKTVPGTATTIKTTPREAMTSEPTSTITSATKELTTTPTTPTTTTTTTTTISPKARTTPTPVRRDVCIPLLGVRTCGCAGLTTNLALLLTAMALAVAAHTL